MKNKSYKICNSKLEIERRCEFCEPIQLFHHICETLAVKMSHPACMVIDVNTMLLESYKYKN